MPHPTDSSLAFLEAMLATPSPVGHEAKIQKVIREHMLEFADDHARDVHGNQWFVLNPDAKIRVMLAGHVDEIGLTIRYIDDHGFLWVARAGGTDALTLWGSRVHVHTKHGPVQGVIGKKPIHHMTPEERTKGPKLEDIYIDIGAKNREEALKRVRIGDCVTSSDGFLRLTHDLIVARGMDDRIGAFVIMEAFKKVRLALKKKKGRKLNCAVYAAGTVQEEVGLRGARTSAYAIDPHVGIAVDVGFATDYPGENKKIYGECKLGNGPILHRGPNINPPLAEMMETLAEKLKIPFQPCGDGEITGTDAGSIQVNKGGVATALVSIPNRYMHSPVEMCSLSDTEASAELIAQTILAIEAGQSFIPEA